MKKQLFLYLFLFAALYIVFQYMNAKKAYEHSEDLEVEVKTLTTENKELSAKTAEYQKQLDSLKRINQDLNYFSLRDNDAAISYFNYRGMNVDTIARNIMDEMIDRNSVDQDNDLVPFPGMDGVMRVNHIKILNHQWILADYTDGVYWGEMLLKYEVDDDGNLSFSTLDTFLYPSRR